ncbi:MAG: hypothetical protein AB7V45_12620 [Candidatus Krumholzibacteriia bacterium]
MNARGIWNGIAGGLAGGMVFGMMMAMMGMLPMIGKMVGQPSAIAGFGVHMMISAGIGGSFAVLLGRFAGSVRGGLLAGMSYGGVWWVLGPLTLMPWMMGMGFGANLNPAAAAAALPSLMGHLVFGIVLGLVHGMLTRRGETLRRLSPTTQARQLQN